MSDNSTPWLKSRCLRVSFKSLMPTRFSSLALSWARIALELIGLRHYLFLTRLSYLAGKGNGVSGGSDSDEGFVLIGADVGNLTRTVTQASTATEVAPAPVSSPPYSSERRLRYYAIVAAGAEAGSAGTYDRFFH